jgi:alpha-galactosidase
MHIVRSLLLPGALAALGCSAQPAYPLAVDPAEQGEARRWVAAKLEGQVEPRTTGPGLVVLANYKEVQRNGRDGQPLKIGGTQYRRGLYCHAPSRVLVQLPGPGKTFSAVVGIDNNGNYGGGTVIFKVNVNAQEPFSSPVMRRGEAGLPVNVALDGATEFALVVTDAGDNFNSDQASWADAKVTLNDGTQLWLGDLPLIPQSRPSYSTDAPFSFQFDGKPSTDLLKLWPVKRTTRALDPRQTQHTLSWDDPQTGLQVRCVAVAYQDFPTVEWTVYFKNNGTQPSPVLAGIQALDSLIERRGDTEFVLHHHKGTFVRADDFEPLTTVLEPQRELTFAPPGGRPLGQVFPYYNLAWSGEGRIIVVGWPGQWSAHFARDGGYGVRVVAGQERTHLRLQPGEEIRTPLMVMQFYQGDWMRGQNIWRRWMLAHNLPRRAGKLPEPMLPAVSGNQFPGLLCNETDEIRYIDRYREERIPITHWWMDAGWYINQGDWGSVGTWEIDTNRFPRGLRYISDYAHARGIKLLVWFEPERVTAGTWLANQHPDWVLGGKQGGLLNLGHPQAWDWLVNHFDKLLTDQGIDFYRQDFNMDPLAYWRRNDSPDRQGITEIKHVQGYLAFWDELVRRHPDMLIDSCASGGHRNDLETLRRSLPLLRSDYIFDSIGEQCHTLGLAPWMPFYGTGFIDFNPYIVRSLMGADTTLSCDARRKDLDWNQLRTLVAQWREIVPNYFGDFYPLTPYSLAKDAWVAWQFDLPEAGTGIVQAFRRDDCLFRSAELRLQGLDPAATYNVVDLDVNQPRQLTGKALLDQGLLVEIPAHPAAVVIRYKKLGSDLTK